MLAFYINILRLICALLYDSVDLVVNIRHSHTIDFDSMIHALSNQERFTKIYHFLLQAREDILDQCTCGSVLLLN